MRAYRIGEAADLLDVSADTVRRWADSGRLRSRRSAGGQRVIDAKDLAGFLARRTSDPETEPIVSQSARNRFAGLVTRVVRDKVAAQVEVQSGPHRLVSLMTREAADELGLQPGMYVVAAVKSTSVVIEIPAP